MGLQQAPRSPSQPKLRPANIYVVDQWIRVHVTWTFPKTMRGLGRPRRYKREWLSLFRCGEGVGKKYTLSRGLISESTFGGPRFGTYLPLECGILTSFGRTRVNPSGMSPGLLGTYWSLSSCHPDLEGIERIECTALWPPALVTEAPLSSHRMPCLICQSRASFALQGRGLGGQRRARNWRGMVSTSGERVSVLR